MTPAIRWTAPALTADGPTTPPTSASDSTDFDELSRVELAEVSVEPAVFGPPMISAGKVVATPPAIR